MVPELDRMNWTMIGIGVSVLGVLMAQWVNLNNEITRLKGRVKHLEDNADEVRVTLRELVQLVTEIKLMLARRGLDQ